MSWEDVGSLMDLVKSERKDICIIMTGVQRKVRLDREGMLSRVRSLDQILIAVRTLSGIGRIIVGEFYSFKRNFSCCGGNSI